MRYYSAALALSLAALLPLVPMQYARYAYPGLLLLVLVQILQMIGDRLVTAVSHR